MKEAVTDNIDLLTVSNISKKVNGEWILNDMSLVLKKAQRLAIAGETGSGKTTLLKIIAGLTQPDKGSAHFENKRIIGPDEQLIPGHPGVVYLSQQFELPHFLTVHQVLIYANPLFDDDAEKDPNAHALYELCRIPHLLKRRTDQLSGGEQQRVALAKQLITSPKLLLLDEPFSNLDMIHKNILKDVIHEIGSKLNLSIIMVSHDPLDTISWADEILVMQAGRLLQQGTPQTIYTRPINEYVAGLFGKYNVLTVEQANSFVDGVDKNIIVRPEDFIIETIKKGVKVIVTEVKFFGSYYEVEALLQKTTIIIRTTKTAARKGDAINIALVCT